MSSICTFAMAAVLLNFQIYLVQDQRTFSGIMEGQPSVVALIVGAHSCAPLHPWAVPFSLLLSSPSAQEKYPALPHTLHKKHEARELALVICDRECFSDEKKEGRSWLDSTNTPPS